MAFSHVELSESDLSPVLQRMLGDASPPQMRDMVAKGLAPLPPAELVFGLYYCWLEGNTPTGEQAAATVAGLPSGVLEGAFNDPKLHPGALDLLARKLLRNSAMLDKLVRHPNVSDDTLSGIARVCPSEVCDTLGDNESRWLACPAIVENLYRNPQAAMSLVHRLLELAERQHVAISLPCMEEIRALLRNEEVDPSRDEALRNNLMSGANTLHLQIERLEKSNFDDDVDGEIMADDSNEAVAAAAELDKADENAVAPVDGEGETENGPEATQAGPQEAEQAIDALGEEPKKAVTLASLDRPPQTKENRFQELLQMKPMEKIRAAMLGDQFDRSVLIRDSNKMVAMATVKSPKIKDGEVCNYASNRSLARDIIRYIANRREWIKLYAVKFNLVMNPKAPLSRSMSLLAYLHTSDIKKVARSRNIASALSKAAKRKLQQQR